MCVSYNPTDPDLNPRLKFFFTTAKKKKKSGSPVAKKLNPNKHGRLHVTESAVGKYGFL